MLPLTNLTDTGEFVLRLPHQAGAEKYSDRLIGRPTHTVQASSKPLL